MPPRGRARGNVGKCSCSRLHKTKFLCATFHPIGVIGNTADGVRHEQNCRNSLPLRAVIADEQGRKGEGGVGRGCLKEQSLLSRGQSLGVVAQVAENVCEFFGAVGAIDFAGGDAFDGF